MARFYKRPAVLCNFQYSMHVCPLMGLTRDTYLYTLGNKFQRNLLKYIFFHKKEFENVVWKTAAILPTTICKLVWHKPAIHYWAIYLLFPILMSHMKMIWLGSIFVLLILYAGIILVTMGFPTQKARGAVIMFSLLWNNHLNKQLSGGNLIWPNPPGDVTVRRENMGVISWLKASIFCLKKTQSYGYRNRDRGFTHDIINAFCCQFTINHNWSWYWLGVDLATSHNLKQWYKPCSPDLSVLIWISCEKKCSHIE